ncbi:MAG: orotidine-5'-phosphate decarboxylase [Chloroflexota bacterium]
MVTDFPPCSKVAPFGETARSRAHQIRSWLCIGLDPVLHRMPAHFSRDANGVSDFCTGIIQSTSHVAAAYKLNLAYFEALGWRGWKALERVRGTIPVGIPVIADAKRGDIGSTMTAYAASVFDVLDCHAVTVSPYLGWDALEPFAAYSGRCLFILAKTSNPGSKDVQMLSVAGEPLYLNIARQALAMRCTAEIGLVVGATDRDAVRRVRALSPETLLLVPGVGAQGAKMEATLPLAANDEGDNALITVSREILYPSEPNERDSRRIAEDRARETWKRAGHGDC